jgi:hypothetical protein
VDANQDMAAAKLDMRESLTQSQPHAVIASSLAAAGSIGADASDTRVGLSHLGKRITLANAIVAALVTAIMLLGGIAVENSRHLQAIENHDQQHQANSAAQNSGSQYEPPETIWQKTWHDPVALYTLLLTAFTFVLAVSTIGLWVVTWRASVAQARDMDRSIGVAQASADAAKKSAQVAESALVELNRAFVFLKSLDIREGETDKTAIDVWVAWENFGVTQTKNLQTFLNCEVFPAANDVSAFDFRDRGTDKKRAAYIGPKGLMPMHPVSIPKPALEAVADGLSRALIWGWVEYDDIFPNTPRHRTEFCSEIVVKRSADGKSLHGMNINHDAYNGAEEECGPRFEQAQRRRPRMAWANQTLDPATQVATATVSDLPT